MCPSVCQLIRQIFIKLGMSITLMKALPYRFKIFLNNAKISVVRVCELNQRRGPEVLNRTDLLKQKHFECQLEHKIS